MKSFDRVLGATLAAGMLVVSGSAVAGPLEKARKLMKEGDAEEAVEVLEEATRKEPKNCVLRRTLGEAYFQAGDTDLGAFTLEQFLRECSSDPELPKIKERLIRYYDEKAPKLARVEDASALYIPPVPPRRATGGRTDDDAWAVDSYTRFGMVTEWDEIMEMMRANHFKSAAEKLQARLKKKPRDSDSWLFLGSALAQSGDPEGAIKAYERYLELAPRDENSEPVRRGIAAARGKK